MHLDVWTNEKNIMKLKIKLSLNICCLSTKNSMVKVTKYTLKSLNHQTNDGFKPKLFIIARLQKKLHCTTITLNSWHTISTHGKSNDKLYPDIQINK